MPTKEINKRKGKQIIGLDDGIDYMDVVDVADDKDINIIPTTLVKETSIQTNKMNADDFVSYADVADMELCNFNTEVVKKEYQFITETSKSINNSLIIFAEQTVERAKYIVKLNELLKDIQVAIDLEAGVFEFSLIHVTVNQLLYSFFLPVYLDKFGDIYMNLEDDSYLQNKTLKPALLSRQLKARFIAFMSPEQIHPEKWTSVLKKRQYRIDKEQNMATTDLYKCYKCGEKKCKVTQLQTRSADEAVTTFITCMVCYNTFVK